jgi:hypothetical protein
MLFSRISFFAAAVMASVFAVAEADPGRGELPGEVKAALGIAPDQAVAWTVVYDGGGVSEAARQREGYDPTKDVVRVELAHVAEDRYVWRTTLAAPPRLDDTVHHIYVDADADSQTGREGYGVEYMLTVAAAAGRATRYEPDGRLGTGPSVRFAVDGNTLLTSADVDLDADAAGARFRMWVLCHTTTSAQQPRAAMSSNTPRILVEGVALTDRTKLILPSDYTEHHRVASTFGLDVIRPLLSRSRGRGRAVR